MAAKWVANSILFHQIDLPPKNFGKLIQHLHPIIEGDATLRCEGHQHVYVTIWAEVLPQNRPEQGKLFDLPPAAEVLDLL